METVNTETCPTLTIENQTTRVTGNAVIGEFAYRVDYEYGADKKIAKFSCTVQKKDYSTTYGSVFVQNSNKTVNLINDDHFNMHVKNVDEILDEIKQRLTE